MGTLHLWDCQGKDLEYSEDMFTSFGVLPLKITNEMTIITNYVIVPISWDERVLKNIYVDLGKNVDILLGKTLNNTLRQGLQGIKNIIKIKSLEHKSFIKHYIEASLIQCHSKRMAWRRRHHVNMLISY